MHFIEAGPDWPKDEDRSNGLVFDTGLVVVLPVAFVRHLDRAHAEIKAEIERHHHKTP